MIKFSEIETLKAFAEMQVNNVPGGVVYTMVDGEKVIWTIASDKMFLDMFKVGSGYSSEGGAARAMREKKTIVAKLPRSLYGVRFAVISAPIYDDKGEIAGAVSVGFPRLHAVAAAFDTFAPILCDMFGEGAFLYMTDLQKFAYTQPSKLFDMPSIRPGKQLEDGDVASQTISSKKPVSLMFDKERYGVPVLVTNVPLYDEDNAEEVVATLGIIIPKATATSLREMSKSLENGLTGISSAIQELAASASQIHTNEQSLNDQIKEILSLSEEINEISTFIKEIADETKMLGLNAAIEAARAGESGKGFGVVAEEIRKLSEQSKSTVPRIKKLTDSIKEKVEGASNKGRESMLSSQEQAAATEEITASIEEISGMAVELNNIAEKL